MFKNEQIESNERRLIRIRGVLLRTGLGRSSLYAAMRAGTFPRGVAIGARAKAWNSLDIDAWVSARIKGAA